MLELLTDFPDNVVAVRANGRVVRADYKNVLLPAVKALYKRKGHVSLLLLLETKISRYSMGALIEDAKLGVNYFMKWHRVAIVSAGKGIKRFTNIFGKLVPGEYKGFLINELEEAKKWVSS
jgi:SpoIIAA-like